MQSVTFTCSLRSLLMDPNLRFYGFSVTNIKKLQKYENDVKMSMESKTLLSIDKSVNISVTFHQILITMQYILSYLYSHSMISRKKYALNARISLLQ